MFLFEQCEIERHIWVSIGIFVLEFTKLEIQIRSVFLRTVLYLVDNASANRAKAKN